MNEVLEAEIFAKVYSQCEKAEQNWIDKMRDQLAQDLHVGKPLRYDWFREKKFRNKRLFYVVNEMTKKVLLITIGDKKEQQAIINHVVANKEIYLKRIA